MSTNYTIESERDFILAGLGPHSAYALANQSTESLRVVYARHRELNRRQAAGLPLSLPRDFGSDARHRPVAMSGAARQPARTTPARAPLAGARNVSHPIPKQQGTKPMSTSAYTSSQSVALLASRTDIPPGVRDILSKAHVSDVKKILAAMDAAPQPARGPSAGDIAPEFQAQMDARMGLTKFEFGVRREGTRQTFGVVPVKRAGAR